MYCSKALNWLNLCTILPDLYQLHLLFLIYPWYHLHSLHLVHPNAAPAGLDICTMCHANKQICVAQIALIGQTIFLSWATNFEK